jgi:hypothetical protein
MKPAANKDDVIDTLIEKIQECYTMARSLKSIPAPTIAAPVVPVARAARAAPAFRVTPAPTIAAPVARAAPASRAPASHVTPAPTIAAPVVPVATPAAYAIASAPVDSHPLLSNNIYVVNNFIKSALPSSDQIYNNKASTEYSCFVNGMEIVLECMWASGNNLDCFVHSFLTAVFPAFRSAVALQFDEKRSPREFEKFATMFRTKVILLIVNYSYEKGIKSGNINTIREELVTGSTELADDLIPYLCYYYNIRILLFGQPSSTNGLSTSRLIGNNVGTIYAISNPGAGHFEPCRTRRGKSYILTEVESNGFTSKYKGAEVERDSEFTRRQQLISGIDDVKNRKTPTNPGELTQFYQAGDTVVTTGEEIYDNLTKLIKKFRQSGNNDIRHSLDRLQGQVRDIEINYVLKQIKKDEAMTSLANIDEFIKTTTNPISVAEAPVPAGQWRCDTCTFLNNNSDKICAMCSTPRPKQGGKRRVRTHRKKHRTGFRKISSQNRRR